MKLRTIALSSAFAALLAPNASAHRFWVIPSTSVLSGESPWVCFDAAVSNDLFFPNHHAPALDWFTATAPDGSPVELQNGSVGKYRTTFDLELAKPGTYRVATVRGGVFARWEENGEGQRWRGTAEELEGSGVLDKPDVSLMLSDSRTETFVTAGEPTTPEPSGKGLELVFRDNHPNDLYAGEEATFTLHQDSKPAAGVEVTVIKGDDRYRDEVGAITVTTGEDGTFTVTWPEAGRYWLNTAVEGASVEVAGKQAEQRASYTATFEVLPE